MSKHIFQQQVDGRDYEVHMGWDKPLQQYYAVILHCFQDRSCEEPTYIEEVAWSTHFSQDFGLYEDLDDIQREIEERGFSIPDELMTNVRRDRYRNAVNEMQYYEAMKNQPQAPTLHCM